VHGKHNMASLSIVSDQQEKPRHLLQEKGEFLTPIICPGQAVMHKRSGKSSEVVSHMMIAFR
jgi:hypothetical protein